MAALEAIDVSTLKDEAESTLKEPDTNVETDVITPPENSASKDVIFSYYDEQLDAAIYSVDIVWSDLTFTYSDGSSQWNPSDHEYNNFVANAGWVDSKGHITVINHSNAEVAVKIAFVQASTPNGTAALNISSSQYTLASAENTTYDKAPFYKSDITATGIPENNGVIGKITVAIQKAS